MGPTARAVIEISAIPEKLVTRLLVPIADVQMAHSIAPLNAQELHLTKQSDDKVKNSLEDAVLNGIVTALVYAILFGLATYFVERRAIKLQRSLDSVDERLQSSDKKNEDLARTYDEGKKEMKVKIRAIEDRVTKQRLYLLARLSDYSRELTFWRDTIRKMLYQAGAEKKTVENILDQVTTTLRTHGTREDWQSELKTLEIAARLLANREKT